jgi:DNA mismatch endonuclease (patch repair protein)
VRYWHEKVARNQRRDRRVARQLRQLGYRVITVWECNLRTSRLPKRLAVALGVRTTKRTTPQPERLRF